MKEHNTHPQTHYYCVLKGKSERASRRPSEHPPVRGKNVLEQPLGDKKSINCSMRMYVCMVITHIARVWINWVRLPIPARGQLNRKKNISLSPFAPENLVSRDGLGSPVSRQPAHLRTQAESGAYLLRNSSRFPRRRPFIYYVNRHNTPSGQSLSLSVSAQTTII